MDFLRALELAVSVIREQQELDEIYLYERDSQTQVWLKDCEGSLQFMSDELLPKQVFLASFKRLKSTSLSLNVIFSENWQVRLRKTLHLEAKKERLGKTKEEFIDYIHVGREEVQDV